MNIKLRQIKDFINDNLVTKKPLMYYHLFYLVFSLFPKLKYMLHLNLSFTLLSDAGSLYLNFFFPTEINSTENDPSFVKFC